MLDLCWALRLMSLIHLRALLKAVRRDRLAHFNHCLHLADRTYQPFLRARVELLVALVAGVTAHDVQRVARKLDQFLS
jgi:hypothetical protein